MQDVTAQPGAASQLEPKSYKSSSELKSGCGETNICTSC